MSQEVADFVVDSKNWIMKKTVAQYLRAKNMFANILREFNNDKPVHYEDLLKLSEAMEDIKEDLNLIFKRLIDPKRGVYEKATKYKPEEMELEFINNVGLIFHKTMVARELKYLMDNYQDDSLSYSETHYSFRDYLKRIDRLFESGTDVLRQVISFSGDNTILMTFIIENDHYVQETFNEPINSLLARMLGHENISDAYVRVGKYYLESGWLYKAKKALLEAKDIGSVDPEVDILLKKVS